MIVSWQTGISGGGAQCQPGFAVEPKVAVVALRLPRPRRAGVRAYERAQASVAPLYAALLVAARRVPPSTRVESRKSRGGPLTRTRRAHAAHELTQASVSSLTTATGPLRCIEAIPLFMAMLLENISLRAMTCPLAVLRTT